jgi:GNAT superfamily N-acetyltransferase
MIEPLPLPASDADVDALAQLLVDTVEHGAAVSFLAPLPFSVARDWWRSTLSRAHPRAVFLVARAADGIVGTVQMHPSWAPNQPQRGEIAKLMVHRRARRTGLARRLMERSSARRCRRACTSTLNTKRGDAAGPSTAPSAGRRQGRSRVRDRLGRLATRRGHFLQGDRGFLR